MTTKFFTPWTGKSAEKRLREAISKGTTLGVGAATADEQIDVLARDEWPVELTIIAATIRTCILERVQKVDPAGLRLRGMRIVGDLNLDNAEVNFPLSFRYCSFSAAPSFESTELQGLDLTGSIFPGISLSGAKIRSNLTLNGIHSRGEILADSVQVTGVLEIDDADLICASDLGLSRSGSAREPALHLDAAVIAGGLSMIGSTVWGEVRAIAADIGVQLRIKAGAIHNAHGDALSLDGAHIRGDANIRGEGKDAEMTCEGCIRLLGVQIDGGLDLRDTVISLGGKRATTTPPPEDSSRGRPPEGEPALDMSYARVSENVQLNSLSVSGAVRANALRAGGTVNMSNATLTNLGGDALRCNGGVLGSDVVLNEAVIYGKVAFHGTQVKGRFKAKAASIHTFSGDALVLDRTRIDAGMELGGLQVLTGYRDFPSPNDEKYQDYLHTTGAIRLVAARVGGVLTFRPEPGTNRTRISAPESGNALNLTRARLDTVYLDGLTAMSGGINFARCSIQNLFVGWESTGASLPPISTAEGWQLGSVHGFLCDHKYRQKTADWLDTARLRGHAARQGFAEQPWKEFAKVYDKNGQVEDGSWLRYEAAKRAMRATRTSAKRIVPLIHEWTVGYGYRPWRVLGTLLVLFALASVVALTCSSSFTPVAKITAAQMRGTDHKPEQVGCLTEMNANIADGADVFINGNSCRPQNYPDFNPFLVGVDSVIPTAPTGQTAAWRLTEPAPIPFAGEILGIFRVMGWVLAALLVASVTGLLRKE